MARCVLVVAICALLPGMVNCGTSFANGTGSDDLVMWSDFYVLIETTHDELHLLQEQMRISAGDVLHVRERSVGQPQIFRLPARYREELLGRGVPVIESPPYSLVDPGIHARRASDDFAVWMSGYKDERIITKTMRYLVERFPEYAALHEIGTSTAGRPIHALKLSDNPWTDEDEPAMFFIAAHHGNELLAPDYVLDLAYYLLSGRDSYGEERLLDFLYEEVNAAGTTHYRRPLEEEYLNDFELWFVPLVNPDGLDVAWERAYWSGRKNARDTTRPRGRWNKSDGVDLNRNYPFYWKSGVEKASSGNGGSIFYRGPRAGSEAETQVMMRLAERERPALALSYHCFATKVLVPYTIEAASSPEPNAAWRLGEELAAAGVSHRPIKGYVADRNLYAVDGTDQDWLYHRFGTMAFIVEGSYLTPDYEPRARRSVQGMRQLSLRALEAFVEGPVLEIHVADAAGQPLEAVVRIVEYDYREGESFRTHPATGRYDYFLHSGGSFTLRVTHESYGWREFPVVCDAGRCPISLKLTPISSPAN